MLKGAIAFALAYLSITGSAAPAPRGGFKPSEMTAEQLLQLPPAVLESYRRQYQGENLIVGGVEVQPEFKYPWTADLFYKVGGHFCGGSLINSTWILTAAHCSTGMRPSSVGVQVHRHDLSSSANSESGVVRDVKTIVIHPEYSGIFFDNDVALWELSAPITNVPFVTLDTDGSYSTVGALATVAGWGATREGGRGSDILLEVDVPILSNEKCRQQYNGRIRDSMICAGYDQGGKDSCQGDSGGPLFVNKNNKPVQIGVVSWGEGCARAGSPGVYARVSYLMDFINDTINGKK